MTELVHDSVFAEDRLQWVVNQAKAEIESLRDQGEVETGWAFLEQLYGAHPLGRPLQGTAESLASLRPDEVRRFHDDGIRRGGILLLVGDLDEDAVLAELREAMPTEAVERTDRLSIDLPDPQPSEKRIRTRSREQAHVLVGHLTVDRRHEDVPALQLAAVALGAGDGLSGRMPFRLRERDGLAYAVSTSTLSGSASDCGRLAIYLGTHPDQVDRSVAAIREELDRLVSDGIEAAELEDARSFLLGREPLNRESSRQWTDILGESLHYAMPTYRRDWRQSRLSGLDVDAVNEAIRRHLRPDSLSVTIGLPEQASDDGAS